ncbi:MAG: 30S ribosomal protein S8 [Magnetococcus sp. WYHC-3]
MSMSDPISDMLSRIRNAQMIRKAHVDIPASKFKINLGRILLEEGYVESCEVIEEEGKFPTLRLGLKYFKGKPVIESIERKSTPGRRVYIGKDDVPRVKQGLGIAIVSTSQGLLSSRQVKARGIGGELVCIVF